MKQAIKNEETKQDNCKECGHGNVTHGYADIYEGGEKPYLICMIRGCICPTKQDKVEDC